MVRSIIQHARSSGLSLKQLQLKESASNCVQFVVYTLNFGEIFGKHSDYLQSSSGDSDDSSESEDSSDADKTPTPDSSESDSSSENEKQAKRKKVRYNFLCDSFVFSQIISKK